MKKGLMIAATLFASVLSAGDLPVSWQRFLPESATDGTPVAQTLTVATVAFDANVPVCGKALSAVDRMYTNLLEVAAIVRQVKSECAKKGGIYREAPVLVCFPEDVFIGINEIDGDGNRSWRDYRNGVFGLDSLRSLSDWGSFYGDVPFPRDRVTLGLRDLALKENVYISCGYETVDADGAYRNVCTLFGPEPSQFSADHGVIGYYYKVHPVGGEREEIRRGDAFRVWPTKIGKIGMIICYDILFPESTRAYGVAGADLVIASTAWTRSYPGVYPNGDVWTFGDHELKGDGPGMSPDGTDDISRSFVEMALRVAAAQNGYYVAVSSLANPGGVAYASVIYPSGRVFCDTGSDYRPGIALANIGVPSRCHVLSATEIIGFDPFADRYPKAYQSLAR